MKKRRNIIIAAITGVILLGALGAVLYNTVQKYRYPLKYEAEVLYWAGQFNVDPYMVFAVIQTESGFDPGADSSAGARGLMQMTSDTFDWIKGKIAAGESLTFADLYDPEVSIRFGVCYLAYCLERYGGDLSTAAAAYHSGIGTVDGLLTNSEYTQDGMRLASFPFRQMNHYVNKINNSYREYRRLYTQ